MFIMQKLLEISMQMDKSQWAPVRFLGKILGIFPVWYGEHLAAKLYAGKWDPVRKYRKRRRKTNARRLRRCRHKRKPL